EPVAEVLLAEVGKDFPLARRLLAGLFLLTQKIAELPAPGREIRVLLLRSGEDVPEAEERVGSRRLQFRTHAQPAFEILGTDSRRQLGPRLLLLVGLLGGAGREEHGRQELELLLQGRRGGGDATAAQLGLLAAQGVESGAGPV